MNARHIGKIFEDLSVIFQGHMVFQGLSRHWKKCKDQWEPSLMFPDCALQWSTLEESLLTWLQLQIF